MVITLDILMIKEVYLKSKNKHLFIEVSNIILIKLKPNNQTHWNKNVSSCWRKLFHIFFSVRTEFVISRRVSNKFFKFINRFVKSLIQSVCECLRIHIIFSESLFNYNPCPDHKQYPPTTQSQDLLTETAVHSRWLALQGRRWYAGWFFAPVYLYTVSYSLNWT